MEAILSSAVWKLFEWLPDFILRRIFAPTKFAQLMKIDIRPRHEPVTVDLGEVPKAEVYLSVANGSPFRVELDRVHLELWIGGAIVDMYKLDRLILKSRKSGDFLMRGVMTEGQANCIVRNKDNMRCSAQVFAEFNSAFNGFPHITHLEGITPRLVNERFRLSKKDSPGND